MTVGRHFDDCSSIPDRGRVFFLATPKLVLGPSRHPTYWGEYTGIVT
jgi:hypothetical protein